MDLQTSIETGAEVEWSSEQNYHFRLSAFRENLLDFFKANPEWITPEHRMKEVVQAVESGLEDLSVSRPYERLQWGIRVPGDDTQTIYVWLDALINYATKAGYPFTPGKELSLHLLAGIPHGTWSSATEEDSDSCALDSGRCEDVKVYR
jgi:methionyl-tRNA synthetase